MRNLLAAPLLVFAALTVSGCMNAKRDVSGYLANAEKYKQAGDLQKAMLELRNAAALRPNDPQVNLALAKLEDESGDLTAAVPHYIQAASPDAHIIEAQLRVAQLLVDSERFAEASGRINATVGSFPGNPDALALRADLAERQGQIGSAKIDADGALQKDRSNARALSVLAMLMLRDKNGEAAVATVDRGLQQHPADLRLLQVRAAALLTINQPQQAVDALKSIIRTSPHNVEIQTALARIEAQNDRLDDAIAGFRTAVGANPSNQAMQLAFVAFLVSQNKDADLVGYLHNLIDANPGSSTYDLLLAEYLRSRNMNEQVDAVLDQAATRLREGQEFLAVQVARAKRDALNGQDGAAARKIDAVLAVDPRNEEALLFRATLDQENGRTYAAIDHLLTAVRFNPVSASAFRMLATAYLATNQPKMAVDAMQRAVAVVPGDHESQIRLAVFLQRASQFDVVRGLMAQMTLQYPNSRAVWVANGQLAIDRKDWSAVSRSITRLRELPEATTDVLSLVGRFKAAQGDNAGAASSYREAVALSPAIDPAVFGEYARASVAAGTAVQAADFLESSVGLLRGTALQQAWAAVMNLRADAGQFDKADVAFRHAVHVTPQDVDLYTGYIRILLAQKKLDSAQQVIAEAVAAGASRAPMLLLSGAISEQRGDIAGAMKAYADILERNPLSLEASNNYANLLADHDPKNVDALQKSRTLLSGAEASGSPYILDTIAWLDYRLGRIEEARRLLNQADADKSPNPQTRFHLAAVLLALGDRPRGLALLDTVKGLNFQGADEARSLAAT